MISLGAVLSPFIFLLWIVPKFSDFAEVAVKSYVVSVFIVFVHVVIIQLASSFLALPENSGNSLVSIAVAIGLFFVLLKTPSIMMQMVFYTSKSGAFKKLGSQIINVMSTDNSSTASRETVKAGIVKTPRKVVAA
jgi:prepilin signal peptidase PulO-like enzyme (type II secretory pathway)